MTENTPSDTAPVTASEIAPAGLVRRLIRAADRAVLSTLQRPPRAAPADGAWAESAGWPYGSLVLIGCTPDARPVTFISTLAEHTRNLMADPRASLLIDGTAGLSDPLTGARATLMGRLERLEPEDPSYEPCRARFLRRHPGAQLYAGFGDFGIWRLSVERAHLVAGFGRIHWVEALEILGEPGLPLEAREADVIDHMNADHADSIELYATHLLGLEPSDGQARWVLTGCDAEGVDLRRGGQIARLPFVKPVQDAEEARVELVRLVKRARASRQPGVAIG
jgi:heme iron utilization protein